LEIEVLVSSVYEELERHSRDILFRPAEVPD
jgi:hypothetical protein